MCPTFKFHADVHALLEPAVGTPLPLGLVNDATPLRHAGVDFLVLHGPLEEALTGLAGEEAVVVAGHLVPAHWTQLFQTLLGVGLVGLVDAGAAVLRHQAGGPGAGAAPQGAGTSGT